MTPRTNILRVKSDGTCHWWPSWAMSASRCPLNVAWFPFDEQRCRLTYESWRYPSGEVNVTAMKTILLQHYQTSGEWHLVSKSSFNLICYPLTTSAKEVMF